MKLQPICSECGTICIEKPLFHMETYWWCETCKSEPKPRKELTLEDIDYTYQLLFPFETKNFKIIYPNPPGDIF